MQHNLAKYADVSPSFVKKVSDKLSVSLSHIDPNQSGNDRQQYECLISFHNTLTTDSVVVNPNAKPHEHENGSSSSWFNFWGKNENQLIENEVDTDPETTILLGYLQLFGFITLNYKFDLNQANSMDSSNANSWWQDKDYYNHYQDGGPYDEDEGDIKESKIEGTEFIQQNYLKNRMVIGGKLGGVSDLVVNNDKSTGSHTINESNKYLISDLIYNFNSATKSKPIGTIEVDREVEPAETAYETEGLPMKEFTDSIIPIYSTSQYLFFTNLKLAPKETKTFQVKFAGPGPQLPPSYNTNLTGLASDQGWISIRYHLIVGLLENIRNKIISRSIYFPLKTVGQKIGFDDKWLQPDYLTETLFEKEWQVEVIEDETENNKHDTAVKTNGKTSHSFLDDLNNLIDSDLESVSKNERRKSSTAGGFFNSSLSNTDLIPQLSSHLKTQFQIRVNDHNLCDLILSKPYYHIGEDINFSIDVNPNGIDYTRVVGIITHLEAHELFHLTGKEKKEEYVNIYKVSPNIRVSSFASSLVNSHESDNKSSLFSGLIHIPQHLCQQFQCSGFMDLKYFLVFKFNLNEFNRVDKELKDDTELTETSSVSSPSLHTAASFDSAPPGFEPEYKFDNNNGSEFRFRIPISILP